MPEAFLSAGATSKQTVKEPWTKPWPRPRPPRVLKTFDHLSDVPDDILINIIDNLSLKDLAICMLVSRSFYWITRESLWKKAKNLLHWFPMFFGAMTGNIPVMEEALRRGCPVDETWLCFKLGSKQGFMRGQRPYIRLVSMGKQMPWNGYWRTGPVRITPEWHVPTGPRYHIFLALLQAGAKPPPREEWYYLIMATHSCRIVSAPTFQLMLQYGANINHLCTCPDHEGLEGEIWPMSYYWFWDNGKAHHKCAHQGDFMPWSQSVRQRVSEEMCGFLVEHDEKFGPLFSTEVDGSKQSDE
ncbi:hypothetical protein B0T11DRAFT_344749 [Plectosphaerella cucumerina]|uniref:F-box domain-containing protein n=1 Tax=Plectosphaerella cucumerina TaxID=40658 RepID=A0A8K0TPB5_9PEZI|nr:hypothetical protein B0T11DRAFT_344749 [Plectosphaerella cucumerina]